MKNDYKILTEKLSDTLFETSLDFLLEDHNGNNYKHMVDLEEILNVVLSAHITSFSGLMLQLAKKDEAIEKKVKDFLDKLLIAIKCIHPMSTIESKERHNKKCPPNCQYGRLVTPGQLDYSTCPVCNGKDELKYQ